MSRSAWNRRPRSIKLAALLSVLVLLTAMAQPALAAVGPLGSEFRVNTYTNSYQTAASAAMDSTGNFVITWYSNGQDGSGFSIHAQRYNSAGVAQGSEFRVNTTTTNNQENPAVAMSPSGDFVIAWQSYGQDGSDYGVYAQRYNSAGVAQGSEFRVNTYTTGVQVSPSVAIDSTGNFVIAWQSFGQDGSGYGIRGQRYDSAGVAQGSEFQVNTYTTNSQLMPSAAMDSTGNFVIAWYSYGQDGSANGTYAQRYDSAGVAQGSEFRVNTYTAGDQMFPAVAMDSSGDFVVSWMSPQDGSGYGVYAQRYSSAGVAQGSEFQVNTYTPGSQSFPAVAMDSTGDFVISWMSGLQDGSAYGVYAQRYSSAGVAQGSEFQVNTYSTDNQWYPAVAMDPSANFVVSWHSENQDGSLDGVYAQRYGDTGPPPVPVPDASQWAMIVLALFGSAVLVWSGIRRRSLTLGR